MLLADCGHGDDSYEFRGEPVGGRCLVTLALAGTTTVVASRVVERERVKATIRAVRDEHLPGATLVFAYVGDDPWPLYTQAGVEERIAAAGRARQEAFFLEQATGIRRPPAPHPADDLLGRDERGEG